MAVAFNLYLVYVTADPAGSKNSKIRYSSEESFTDYTFNAASCTPTVYNTLTIYKCSITATYPHSYDSIFFTVHGLSGTTASTYGWGITDLVFTPTTCLATCLVCTAAAACTGNFSLIQ